jgi:serine phosphatase RsbU (regulator of sigma subunit)
MFEKACMKKTLLLLPAFIFCSHLGAQINKYGVPPMKNYSTQVTQGAEYNWSIVKDHLGVLYVGNDSKGILRFDGHAWSSISTGVEGVVRTLGVSEEGVVYVGGSFEFGYLQPSDNGTVKYVSISSRLNTEADTAGAKGENPEDGTTRIGEIVSMLVTDSVIYFNSYESLFKYYPERDSLKSINLKNYGFYQVVKMALINNRIILADNRVGLLELKNDKPVKIDGGEFFSFMVCLVLMPSGENGIFIGTYNNGVFEFDLSTGKVNSSVVDPALNEIFKTAQVYAAADLPTGERLVGTLGNGIYIFDKKYRLIGKWDKETTEMADNTVTAFYSGSSGEMEMWFASAGYLTKAYVGLPFTEIFPKTGYEGLVNVLTEFNGDLYLSTDLGLFKSYTSSEGLFAFKRVGNINNSVLALLVANAGKEEFLLACSNQGIYRIGKNGSISILENIMKFSDESKRAITNVRCGIQSSVNRSRFYFGLNVRGVLVADYTGYEWRYVSQVATAIQGYVTSLIEDKNGDLFIFTGNPGGIYLLPVTDTIPRQFTTDDGLPESSLNILSRIGDEIVLGSGNGLFRYVRDTGKWAPFNELLGGYTRDLECKDIKQDIDGDIWITISDDRIYEILFRKDSVTLTPYRGPLNPLPNLEKIDFKEYDNRIWMTKSKSIYVINKEKIFVKPPVWSALLSKIIIGTDSILMNNSFYETLPDGKRVPVKANKTKSVPEIKFNFNSVSFYWTMPYYLEDEGTLFSYRLEGFDKSWSKWEKTYYKDFTNLPFGKYTFRVKAKTVTDIISEEAVYEFYILKPWYLTAPMIILYIIAVVFIIFLIIMAYTRKLKNENIRLEGIVAERTAVVVKQKEELESSIHYARRIQMALLPSDTILSENLKNYFILFKPRDIVSGDFYWMTKKENRLYIVAADCTGHGVPGAFMSLLGMSFLDEIIDKDVTPRADAILSELRLHVTESLKQSGGEDEAKDGMDLALLVIDFDNSRVEFSGAYNPCFRVRRLSEDETSKYSNDEMEMADGSMSNGKYLLETIYASKMPIGISSRMDEEFVFYDWNLEKGVSYYLFSDGYIDQFGGPSGRKFMKKNFKRFILEMQDYPMKKQKEMLDENLKQWMGQSPQIDDILVMGIRTD